MFKKIISLLVTFIIVFASCMCFAPTINAATPKEDKNSVITALNDLLAGFTYDSGQNETNVKNWSDEEITEVIYSKLNRICNGFDLNSLNKVDLKYRTNEDYYSCFDLSAVQKVTQDVFGRDFPTNIKTNGIFTSNNEVIIMPATGETTSMVVQDFIKQGNRIIAVGMATCNTIYSVAQGYFEAVFEKNPSSIYGYTLATFSKIYGNQNFENLTATASSTLKEATVTHYAANVLDKNEKTAWVEGVSGYGINEWIKLETTDGSSKNISAIEFTLGYHKSQQLLEKNGWPSKVLIEFENGYKQEFEFYAHEEPNVALLDKAQTASSVKITILEAGMGSKYDDTCISEISLYGIDTELYFEKYSNDGNNTESQNAEYSSKNAQKQREGNVNYILVIAIVAFLVIVTVTVVIIILVLKNKNKSNL